MARPKKNPETLPHIYITTCCYKRVNHFNLLIIKISYDINIFLCRLYIKQNRILGIIPIIVHFLNDGRDKTDSIHKTVSGKPVCILGKFEPSVFWNLLDHIIAYLYICIVIWYIYSSYLWVILCSYIKLSYRKWIKYCELQCPYYNFWI